MLFEIPMTPPSTAVPMATFARPLSVAMALFMLNMTFELLRMAIPILFLDRKLRSPPPAPPVNLLVLVDEQLHIRVTLLKFPNARARAMPFPELVH